MSDNLGSEFIRHPKDKKKNFTLIQNSLIRMSEKKLSLEARALLFYFLSADDGWKFRTGYILSELETCKERFYRMVDELRERGYMLRTSYYENNLKKYKYLFSENSHQEFIDSFIKDREENPKKPKLKKSFRCPGIQDTGIRDLGKQDSKNTNEENQSKNTNSGSPSYSSPITYLEEHCHCDAGAKNVAMSFNKLKEKEESREGETPFESPEEAYEKGKPLKKASPSSEVENPRSFLISTGIEMRPDVLDYLSNTNTLSKLKETHIKYQNTAKCMRKVNSPIKLFRSILTGSIAGMKGSVGMSNEEWAKEYVRDNQIEGVIFKENYVKNSVTEDDISFEIDSYSFKMGLKSWFEEE